MLHKVIRRFQSAPAVLVVLLLLASGTAVAQPGTGNTTYGTNAFIHNTTGSENAAFGQYTLYWN